MESINIFDKERRNFHFIATFHGEVRKVQDLVWKSEDGQKESHTALVSILTDEEEMIYLKDKDLSREYEKGMEGVFSVRIDVDELNTQYDKAREKEIFKPKTSIIITDFKQDKKKR